MLEEIDPVECKNGCTAVFKESVLFSYKYNQYKRMRIHKLLQIIAFI